MAIMSDEHVVITQAEKPGDPTVISVNCPDKLGLACELSRIVLFFGLSITKGDASTDGKWCYVVFWVVGKSTTRWNLLKKRLLEVCPPQLTTSGLSYCQPENQHPEPPNVYLLKFWCSRDRRGQLHDVTRVLCELELTIKRVNASTMPDGNVMDLFYVTDTREQLHTEKRKEKIISQLKAQLGGTLISCEIELAGQEVTACSQGSSFIPSAITEDTFSLQMQKDSVSVIMDTRISPSHTLIQIQCQDHKGLVYNVMRTLKDYNIQVCYGRFSAKPKKKYELDLFITEANGIKLLDPNKQNSMCSQLRMDLLNPFRVVVASRGADAELVVANPVELSGRGRPLMFHDITFALKILNINIFSVEIGRHKMSNREWEVYRILLDEGDGLSLPRNKIEEDVRDVLMGWR